MKTFLLALTIMIPAFFSQGSVASALLVRDDENKELRVIARMVYSGAAATEQLAHASTEEILSMWNENPTTINMNNVTYSVTFKIDYVISAEGLKNPDSCAYNFIEIKDKVNPSDRSYYRGLGSRTGVFFTSDSLGTSTTTAHEFGHGLLLDHPQLDQRTAEVPGIMFARGTLVRPEFQYNPSAEAGAPGGTINPVHRKVRSQDILAIPFVAKAMMDQKNVSCLGDGLPLTLE